MTLGEIIRSLDDQALDKDKLADGDPDGIFAADAADLREAVSLIENLMDKGWIRIKDRLPSLRKNVLVLYGDGSQYVAYFTGSSWFLEAGLFYNIQVHEPEFWRFLPEPPEKEGGTLT